MDSKSTNQSVVHASNVHFRVDSGSGQNFLVQIWLKSYIFTDQIVFLLRYAVHGLGAMALIVQHVCGAWTGCNGVDSATPVCGAWTGCNGVDSATRMRVHGLGAMALIVQHRTLMYHGDARVKFVRWTIPAILYIITSVFT